MVLDANFVNEIIQTEPDNAGIDLIALSYKQPTLVIFLRHFGCTFCREALYDLSQIKKAIDKLGVQLVYVHMVDKETADLHLSLHNLQDSCNISDPNKQLYEYFGLQRGSFRQLYGLSVMMRGLKAGMVDGHGHGFNSIGDIEQMPGLFMLQNGKVVKKFIHQYASDRPDYLEFTEMALAKLDLDNEKMKQ